MTVTQEHDMYCIHVFSPSAFPHLHFIITFPLCPYIQFSELTTATMF